MTAKYRKEVMGARLILVEGRIQKSPEGIVHLVAEPAAIDQNSAMFHNRHIVDDHYGGMAFGDEGARCAALLTDPKIKVFLISLKAGGVGLNLTAARYTFIMDPWWNPAVEEQAIARAHRIGQTQQVISYKIVVRNSIEEKILQLQEQKQDLINAFMDGEGEANLMRTLTPEDLDRLMS